MSAFIQQFFAKISLMHLPAGVRSWLQEVWTVFWTLLKIMVPALIVVRFIDIMGWVDNLAAFIAPTMAWVGLPGEVGLVWMSAIFSSIYTGMAVFYQLGLAQELSVAQASVMGTMILIAHSLPVEVAIARATGVSVIFTLVLRIGGAFVLGAILHWSYTLGGWLQEPLTLIWQPTIPDSGWVSWLRLQLNTLAAALLVIAALTLLIRVLRVLGIERVIHILLSPVLKLMGIGKNACNIMLVGFTLGIGFGGGLLIKEARSGQLTPKDTFLVMAFLGLCHSFIEDTLLIALLGADLSAILWARLAFALVLTFFFALCLRLWGRRLVPLVFHSPIAK